MLPVFTHQGSTAEKSILQKS